MDIHSDGWLATTAGDARIRVSRTHPMAVVERAGSPDLVVAWPGLRTGLLQPEVRVAGTPGGVWVAYAPVETSASIPPETAISAVHIAPDGRVRHHPGLPAVAFLGATRHGLWLSSEGLLEGAEDDAAWRRHRGILVVRPDGTRRTVMIDRVPVVAGDDGTTCRLIAFAGAPDLVPEGGGSVSFAYAQVAIPLPGELPDAVSGEDEGCIPLAGDEWGLAPDAMAPREEPGRADDPVVRWETVDMPEALERAAVDAVLVDFGDPDAYWRQADGRRSPLTDGVSASRVEVVGAWPSTRVEVSFRHPRFPDGRMRRTVAVFDPAGRVATTEYAAIHLMEDIDTGRLPPVSDARDGILEV